MAHCRGRRVLLRLLAVLGVGVCTVLAGAAPAGASVEQVLQALRSDPLYVSPRSTLAPDAALVRSALRSAPSPTYVVVVAQAEVDAEELGIDGFLLRTVEGLGDPRAVVLVVTDGAELAAAGGEETGRAPTVALDRIIESRLDEPFTTETVTSAVLDFVRGVQQAPKTETVPSAPSRTRRTVGLVGLVCVVVLGVGLWLYGRWRPRTALPEGFDDDGDEDDGETPRPSRDWRGTAASGGGTTEP